MARIGFKKAKYNKIVGTTYDTLKQGGVPVFEKVVDEKFAGEFNTAELYANPQHPYTEGLLSTLPKFGQKGRLATIPGVVPPSGKFPAGCVFAPRCKYATEKCHACKPELYQTEDGHKVRCFRFADQEVE